MHVPSLRQLCAEAVPPEQIQHLSDSFCLDGNEMQANPIILKLNKHFAQYLRDYQLKGIQFLAERHAQNLGAILGDDMGLGKTVQCIGFLAALLGKTGDEARDRSSVTQRSFIVCVPSSVKENWQREFDRWGYFDVPGKDGIIVSHAHLRDHDDELSARSADVLIIDEVHRFKNHTSALTLAGKRVRARVKIGLTGTIIQNDLLELWCLCDLVEPGCLDKRETFQEVALRIRSGRKAGATPTEVRAGEKATERIQGVLRRMHLRRDKSVIADKLKGKEDRVQFCELSPRQAELYRSFLQRPEIKLVLKTAEGMPPASMPLWRNQHPDGERCGACDRAYGCMGLVLTSVLYKIANHLELVKVKKGGR